MFDLLVIGGGINGTGIARDAAGRGLKTILCEKDDLAQHTSSSSTKLIHGGLRYLEQYEFRLVREALIEREILLRAAPHIIWPLRFCLPYDKGLRPAWLLRLGLFIYDHLGGCKLLPPTTRLDLTQPPHNNLLQHRLTFGFEYSDCWVEDSRLVVLNAMDAKQRGAEIHTRTKCISLKRHNNIWEAVLQNSNGDTQTITAKAVVNAAGPWVDDIIDTARHQTSERHLRLVKGSHIVTRKLFDGDHAYIFQNGDNRIIFAIPYEHDFTLIGTTDMGYAGDRDAVTISDEEINYLLECTNEYFETSVTHDDIVWTYSGVRPLYEENKAEANSTVTRDYVLDLNIEDGGAPLLSIFGGKITTYRKLSEHALKKLAQHLPMQRAWTKHAALPGGDIPNADFETFFAEQKNTYPWLEEKTLHRLARHYGTRLPMILGEASTANGLGKDFGGGLYQAEVDYVLAHEFAQSADDILWRRTKLGLHLTEAERAAFLQWFQSAHTY